MSRATVRAAIAAWFTGQVTFLSTVHAHPPKTVKEGEAFTGETVGTGSGAVGWVFLGKQSERRIALGGATSGKKRRSYQASMLIAFVSHHPKSEDASTDHDTMMDAFTARLQAGRTLGGSVFQAGEGDTLTGEDVHVDVDLPKVAKGGTTFIWARVDFVVVEMLTT